MNDNRKQLKEKYHELYSEVEAILFKHDLVEINYEDNTDEYSPEVDTILPRLHEASNKENVASIIYEEFNRWFDEDLVKNKNNPKYKAMATEVWEAWLNYKNLA